MNTVYTIGSGGSDPVTLLGVLAHYRITELYDIRPIPNHNAKHFVRAREIQDLIARIGSAGDAVQYRRVAELVPSRRARGGGQSKRWTREAYCEAVESEAIREAKTLMRTAQAPCILGSEHSWGACYRGALAEEVSASDGSSYPTALTVKHLNGQEFHLETIRKWKLHTGKAYDLAPMFSLVNTQLFGSRYRAEDIIVAWVPMSHRLLGYFAPPALIALNPVLDQVTVPEALARATLYHELLHLQRLHDGLPRGHTVEFRKHEVLGPDYGKRFGFDPEAMWEALTEYEKNRSQHLTGEEA